MDCPVCRDAMITLELADVEIDHCTACGGIWLDSGELEMLLDDPTRAKRLLDSFEVHPKCTEQKRKCPICRKKMQKIVVGSANPILLIDKCTRGHGLWFDKGELEDIFERAELDKESKIQKLLADMFGREKNSAHE